MTQPAPENDHARPPGDFDRYRATRFFNNLNGLRCVAILAVLWHHAGGSDLLRAFLAEHGDAPLTVPLALASRGYLGVDVFFVISGYLIVTLLLRERDRRGHIDLKKFYARRSLRIFPVYYAFIAGITALYLLTKPGSAEAGEVVSSLPTTLLYLSNVWLPAAGILHVTWSLATEEQFYILWAPAEKWLKGLGLTLLLGGIIALSLVTHTGVFDGAIVSAYDGYIPSLFGTTLLPIALGVVLAHAMHHPRPFRWVARACAFPGAPAVYALAVLGLTAFWVHDLRGWSRPTLQLLMVGLVAALILRDQKRDSPVARVLQWAPLARIGIVSYGIYLFHLPITGFLSGPLSRLANGLMHDTLLFLAAVAATWGAAELSFRFFEQPILKLKKRYETTPAHPQNPPTT